MPSCVAVAPGSMFTSERPSTNRSLETHCRFSCSSACMLPMMAGPPYDVAANLRNAAAPPFQFLAKPACSVLVLSAQRAATAPPRPRAALRGPAPGPALERAPDRPPGVGRAVGSVEPRLDRDEGSLRHRAVHEPRVIPAMEQSDREQRAGERQKLQDPGAANGLSQRGHALDPERHDRSPAGAEDEDGGPQPRVLALSRPRAEG